MKIGYYLKEAAQGIRRNFRMTLSSISAIAICLLILGATVILYVTLNEAIAKESQKTQYLAFVDETCSDRQALSIQVSLEAVENVATVEFVDRDTAKYEFAEFLQSPDLIEMPSDIFRHRFVITMEDPERTDITLLEIGLIPGIAEISGDSAVIDGYATLRLGMRIIAGAVIIMMMIISLVVINNALTASFARRKKENGIMRLCGVSEGHIRRPLVIEGTVIGLISAIISFLLLWLFYHLLYKALLEAGIAQAMEMKRFLLIGIDIAVVYVGVGILLGAVAGRLAAKSGKIRNNKKGGAFAI